MKFTLAFLRWMRQVLPRDSIVGSAVSCALGVELLYLWNRIVLGINDEETFERLRLLVQVFSLGAYGTYRVATFHPVNDASYRQWLEMSPWTPRQKLPMGPAHLVWQDLVVVAASMGLTRIYDERVAYLPATFLATYSLMLAICVWSTGQKIWGYLLAITLGGVLLTIQQPLEMLMVSAAIGLFSLLPLQASLRSFPWTLPWYLQSTNWKRELEERKEQRTGWPFDVMSPPADPNQPVIETIDGIGVSLLVSWWFGAVFCQLPREIASALAVAPMFFLGMIGGIVRLSFYCKNHRAPISFFGRLRTLRPWQVGYDLIILAPLAAGCFSFIAMLITSLALFDSLQVLVGIPSRWVANVAAPMGIAGTLMIQLLGGPHLGRWKLTGRHRVVFEQTAQQTGLGSTGKQANFVQTG